LVILSKQDGVYTRTAAALEEKLAFGKKFSEMLGLINDARDKVDSVESSLHNEITEQVTTLMRDSEKIVMEALKTYVKTEDLDKVESTLKSQFKVMAENISMSFYETTVKKEISNVDDKVQSVYEDLEKHFEFTVDGLKIKAGAGSIELVLDNDVIKFMKNGQQFGWWDGVNFLTGNIEVKVNERAQFGDFAYVPRSNGSLSFLKVGG
jgi:hypothetical protein